MDSLVAAWQIKPSIFTQGSDDDENQAYREDPLRGIHRHGPACGGDERALIYPLSQAARICCETAPKEEDEAAPIVRLRMCKESMFFTLSSFPDANIEITSPDRIDEDDTEWQHQFQVRLYPDPDDYGVEVYNGCPRLPIYISSDRGEEARRVEPSNSLRLSADRTWAIKITTMHTFGVILPPFQDVYTALVEHTLQDIDSNKIFNNRPMKGGKSRVRSPILRAGFAPKTVSRTITLSEVLDDQILSHTPDNTEDESTTAGTCTPPAVREAFNTAEVLFETGQTRVDKLMFSGKIRVRKFIRAEPLHRAARKWEEEKRVLVTLQHPNVIRCIEFDIEKRSIDFEYGGKDLSKLRNKSHMFDVARDRVDVQMRIWLQATAALHYLHNERCILHGDIKPQNVLLSDDHQTVRLCDFGHSRSLNSHDKGGGTHNYVAPEYLLEGGRSAASDVWSLGVTMLYVLGIIHLPNVYPEPDGTWDLSMVKDDPKEGKKMAKWIKEVTKKVNAKSSKEMILLREMLDHNPDTRITSADLLGKLSATSSTTTQRHRKDRIAL